MDYNVLHALLSSSPAFLYSNLVLLPLLKKIRTLLRLNSWSKVSDDGAKKGKQCLEDVQKDIPIQNTGTILEMGWLQGGGGRVSEGSKIKLFIGSLIGPPKITDPEIVYGMKLSSGTNGDRGLERVKAEIDREVGHELLVQESLDLPKLRYLRCVGSQVCGKILRASKPERFEGLNNEGEKPRIHSISVLEKKGLALGITWSMRQSDAGIGCTYSVAL
ncbi:hypothetical protein NC653_037189 [Populus alba x Populus x berolinensis]|uniref:Uncharacterized protein n=1 Tax=Populus alba x Populus x berolinensis TaxID=444605 RepID=A0AAD6LDQ8_9ROSI|nr:hypothetical protein NC653_037189 [Populus alba x Populus x berolinensis]